MTLSPHRDLSLNVSTPTHFGEIRRARLGEVVQKIANKITVNTADLVFDVKYKIAHILENNDPIGLQLSEMLR